MPDTGASQQSLEHNGLFDMISGYTAVALLHMRV
jgi:hypothetical protein